MGVASLVLGIISIIFAFTGPIGFIGIIAGVTGIILGAIARKKEPTTGIATGGLITSIVGTSIAVLLYLACIACVVGGKKAFEEASKDPQIMKSVDNFTKGLKQLEQEANKAANKNK